MSIQKVSGFPLLTLGLGTLLGGLAASGHPVTAALTALAAMATGLAFMLNSRREDWEEVQTRSVIPAAIAGVV